MTASSRSAASSAARPTISTSSPNESCRALMDLAVEESLAIGNGILTVENEDAGLGAGAPQRGRQGRLRRARGADHDRDAQAPAEPDRWRADDRPGAPPVRQANKRGAARLAAVQALYQMDVAGSRPAGDHRRIRGLPARQGGRRRDLSRGGRRNGSARSCRASSRTRRRSTRSSAQALTEDWPLSRLDSTLRAILRAGVYELMERADVPVAVIVTEYVDIAKAFYDEDEPKLVNAVLDRVARRVRGEGQGQGRRRHERRLTAARGAAHGALLAAAQAIVGSAAPIAISIGGLAGYYLLGDDKSLATAPVTGFNVGVALGAHSGGRRHPRARPAARLHDRHRRDRQRRRACAPLRCSAAISGCSRSACCVIGIGGAFVQQFRFAAADNAPPALQGARHLLRSGRRRRHRRSSGRRSSSSRASCSRR